jgi:hypothetical protein
MPNIFVSDEFLLWSQLLLLWALITYGASSDPLPEDLPGGNFKWQTWQKVLIARVIAIAFLVALLSHSMVLVAWLATSTATHPWIRLRSPRKWTAELEIALVLSNIIFSFAFVRHFHLTPHVPLLSQFAREHVAATMIVLAILLFTVRGGTYIVRGCLRKAGTLPHVPSSQKPHSASPAPHHQKHSKSSHLPDEADDESVDITEMNRGRLIGNLERLVLTLVIAAGSYAALGFLVAAKGLIRSEDLDDRNFAEYFLIGSLASALVALCNGIVIRFALSVLWPDLLSLHMQ